jgi:hypothetical protein
MANLRNQAKGRKCQIRIVGICTDNSETVVLCHFRVLGVSGIGLKSPDLIGAWGCAACHRWVDTHKDPETQLSFAHGCFRTQALLIKEGLVAW